LRVLVHRALHFTGILEESLFWVSTPRCNYNPNFENSFAHVPILLSVKSWIKLIYVHFYLHIVHKTLSYITYSSLPRFLKYVHFCLDTVVLIFNLINLAQIFVAINTVHLQVFFAIFEAKWGPFKVEYSTLKVLPGSSTAVAKMVKSRPFKGGTIRLSMSIFSKVIYCQT